MSSFRFESICGYLGIGSATTVSLGNLMGWLSVNATIIGIAIAFLGLMVQGIASIHNIKLKKAANKREEDEHEIKMCILRDQYIASHIQKDKNGK